MMCVLQKSGRGLGCPDSAAKQTLGVMSGGLGEHGTRRLTERTSKVGGWFGATVFQIEENSKNVTRRERQAHLVVIEYPVVIDKVLVYSRQTVQSGPS